MIGMPDLSKWLNDCERNAKKGGLCEYDILNVFLDKTNYLMNCYRIEVMKKERECLYNRNMGRCELAGKP